MERNGKEVLDLRIACKLLFTISLLQKVPIWV
jgi:hypothetical protein